MNIRKNTLRQNTTGIFAYIKLVSVGAVLHVKLQQPKILSESWITVFKDSNSIMIKFAPWVHVSLNISSH